MHKLPLFLLGGALVALTGCNPLDALNSEIINSGHIPFANPLAHSNTGTLVGGRPSRLQLVAPPETCFPSAVNGVPTQLRFRDDTVLPNQSKLVSVGFDANVKVLSGLSSANGTLNAGVNFSHVEQMELSFDGVHIEYMDSVRVTQFYQTQMPAICKDYLDQVGFIIQALQADKMTFKFFSKDGGALNLSVDNIKSIIDVSVDLKWEIDNNVSLVITTPKYLGYQLGKLQRKDNGFAFFRASRTKNDTFVFDSIGVFGAQALGFSAEAFQEPTFEADPESFLPIGDPIKAF
jgi:hypothetical protein